jgi:hypothetical protein
MLHRNASKYYLNALTRSSRVQPSHSDWNITSICQYVCSSEPAGVDASVTIKMCQYLMNEGLKHIATTHNIFHCQCLRVPDKSRHIVISARIATIELAWMDPGEWNDQRLENGKLAAYSKVHLIPLLKCVQSTLNTCQYDGTFGETTSRM